MAAISQLLKAIGKASEEPQILDKIAKGIVEENAIRNLFKRKPTPYSSVIIPNQAKYQPALLTVPGQSPRTFNGQAIEEILSPKGGKVKHKFFTDQGSEYIMTEDGFARRIKPVHSNDVSQIGLHDWNHGNTMFVEPDLYGSRGVDQIREQFPLAFPSKTNGGLVWMTPENGTWRAITAEELFPTAVKIGQMQPGPYIRKGTPYPTIGSTLFEWGGTPKNFWRHVGSPVSAIEFKQGGRLRLLPKRNKI